MPAWQVDVESLTQSLGEDAPSGPDLSYDAAFVALEDASTGTPEQQYGDTVIAAEPPDWTAVAEQAAALAERTRDLRVALALVRSGAHLGGLPSAERGLALLRGLLTNLWSSVHPQLDADDSDDPTMRLNALMPLVVNDAVLADLRAASLSGERGGLTVRDVELVLGRGRAHGDETVPTRDSVQAALAQLTRTAPAAAQAAQQALEHVQAIQALLNERVPASGPDLAPLLALLRPVADALAPAGDAQGGGTAGASGSAEGDGASSGTIRSRNDARRELERVCRWFETNEPSHPAPLLLRRVLRLVDLNFVDIVRDLAPDGMAQITQIAGTPAE